MVKMYGTELCPDVRAAIAMFKDKNIEVDFRDFSESIFNLKEFILMRDSSPCFEAVKQSGSIGIPCFLFEDGRISFDPEDIEQ